MGRGYDPLGKRSGDSIRTPAHESFPKILSQRTFTHFPILFYLIDNFPMLPYTTFMTHEEARKRLTPLETRFTKEYPIDWVGSAAYMRASGTTNKKSASVQASKFLKKQKIQDAIQVYVKEQLGPLEKHLLENVEFWISIRDDSTVTPTVRLKASEALAKYEQMFVEKKEVSIEGQVRIIDDV